MSRLVSLWICYPLFPWTTGTFSWYATVSAYPDSNGYLATTIRILLTKASSLGSFRYFWIVVFVLASFFSISQGVPVGVIGETDRSDVRPSFDPLLDSILQTLRNRRATNPKYKSYAMYGILESLGVHLSTLDYRKSQGQINHELMTDLLRWRPAAVTLLLDAGKLEANTRRTEPSWVQDWSSLPLSPTTWTDFFLSNRMLDAAPSDQPHIQFDDHDRALLIEGHWCGIISSCVDRFQEIGKPS